MSGFAHPAFRPGQCPKCRGSGVYRWGPSINGRPPQHSGECFSCNGTGRQDQRQIRRNQTYNRYRLAEIV